MRVHHGLPPDTGISTAANMRGMNTAFNAAAALKCVFNADFNAEKH
jgi:hypothetical protein